jgi:hypothetical protein
MTAGAAAIVANAVVIGRPVWTPEILAALAAMFLQYQLTPERQERTPPEAKDPESPDAN